DRRDSVASPVPTSRASISGYRIGEKQSGTRSDFQPSTVLGTKEAAALRDFDPADVRFGSLMSKITDVTQRLCPLWSQKRTNGRRLARSALCQKADICTAASELRGYSITSSAGALKIGRNEHYGEGRKRANINADFVCGISVRMSGDPPGAVAGKTATFDPADAGWEQHADEGFLGLVGPIWRRPDGDSYRYAFLAEDKHR